jgi:hypothetical protein
MLKAGSSLARTSPLDTIIIPHIREKVNSQNAQTFAAKNAGVCALCIKRRAPIVGAPGIRKAQPCGCAPPENKHK